MKVTLDEQSMDELAILLEDAMFKRLATSLSMSALREAAEAEGKKLAEEWFGQVPLKNGLWETFERIVKNQSAPMLKDVVRSVITEMLSEKEMRAYVINTARSVLQAQLNALQDVEES